MVSYEKRTVNIELVEVNKANAPDVRYIQEQLNQIYKPAIIDWQVTKYSKKLQVTFENGIFDNDDPDERMDYTESEKQVIREFKRGEYQKDKLYLFFINEEVKDKNLLGYMPLNRQFGFVFSNDQNPDELIRTMPMNLVTEPFA
ncbi:MAG: hypothetical protein HC905_17430 [Bacteroidales bacterium]|nr:hypothetical protein [Bacteroidales bacterium]